MVSAYGADTMVIQGYWAVTYTGYAMERERERERERETMLSTSKIKMTWIKHKLDSFYGPFFLNYAYLKIKYV